MDNPTRHLPPLSRLRPFEAAARHENFSLAAAELGMTQTAISKQIGLLEKELGITLFERRNRAVFLTEAGRRLGRVIGDALSDVATEVAVLRGHRRSTELVLHCQLCEAFYWLMPRLVRFHERYPGIELRIVSTLFPITQATESFDVAIQTTGRVSGSVRLAFTASDEVFPVCAPSLVPKESLPLTLSDLKALPLLAHSVIPQEWMDWPSWFGAVGLRLPRRFRAVSFDSYPITLQAAVAGQGVALGWRRTTEGLISEGKLIRPCKELVERPTEISVFHGSRPNKHPDSEKLLGWLAEELKN